jgi:RNA polymerase sigma factor (sigma-70 family)
MEQVINEIELLRRSAAGDREAFGLLVERHQSLVYAIAYSATGSMDKSEELAQETFLQAWRNLRQLRDPVCFRGWLGTIVRNLASRAGKNRLRDVLVGAGALEEVATPAAEPGPAETLISRERQEMVWSALQRIPLKYREPMVLFYSAGRSVREVSDELGLSEHVVRQRLYRGRQLLNAEVSSLVEDTLTQVRPGRAFSAAVVALLPAVTAPAAGAVLVGAKGVPAAKALLAGGIGGAVLGPLVGLLGGLLGTWASIHNTHSPRERRFMIRTSIVMWLLLAALMGVLTLALVGMVPRWAFWACFAVFFALLPLLITLTNVRQRQIQMEEGTYPPPPGPPPRFTAGSIYGGFAGGIFGSISWFLLMAGIAHDWLVFALSLAGAMLTFLVTAHIAYRYGRRDLGAWLALAGIAVLTFTAVDLRWDVWLPLYRQSRYYDPGRDIPLKVLNVIMIAAFAGTALVLWVALRRRRPEEPGPPLDSDAS